jgi:ATP-dependent Clp protease ATP-binding subunit ClpB
LTDEGASDEELQDAMNDRFAIASSCPEFLNRIDDTIVFHPLQRESTDSQHREVCNLDRLEKQLEQSQIRMRVTEAAIDHIAVDGLRSGVSELGRSSE